MIGFHRAADDVGMIQRFFDAVFGLGGSLQQKHLRNAVLQHGPGHGTIREHVGITADRWATPCVLLSTKTRAAGVARRFGAP